MHHTNAAKSQFQNAQFGLPWDGMGTPLGQSRYLLTDWRCTCYFMIAAVAAFDVELIAHCRPRGSILPGRILGLAGPVFRQLGRAGF